MAIDDFTREPATWLLDFAGDPVTLTTVTVDGYDDYGDPITSEVTAETNAEIVIRGTPAFERRIDGVDSSVTAVAWIRDSFDVYTGDESDVQAPTTVESPTHEFELYEWFDENNGKLRLHLE